MSPWSETPHESPADLERRLGDPANLYEVARSLLGARVQAQACRVEDMQYPDAHFDLIFADGVLHHLNMQEAVPNLVRVLNLRLTPLREGLASYLGKNRNERRLSS